MSRCLTIKLTPEISGCLLENPACGHAQQLGFSFICCHPDHTKFHTNANGSLRSNEALQRYNMLKHQRRNDFIAELDEEKRRIFCLRNG